MASEGPGRAAILSQALGGALTNAEAARRLGLSERQVRRLKRALAQRGPTALAHGNRGRSPAHRLPNELRARLVELATTSYADYHQQRVCELLAEREQIKVTRSTLRRVLLEAGVRSSRRRGPRRLSKGMMPVAFDLTRRQVRLLDLRGADFHEPFFHQTLERWRRERPESLSFELDLESFLALARLEPGRQPDGFVFHSGRCGSTLLANMLSVVDQYLVLKESPAVNGLMAGLLNATDDVRRREREALVQVALPFMFRHLRGTEQRLFFKLSSWNIRLADTLLQLFPSTPAVFLYRAASPSVASMLAERPGWHHLLRRPRAMQARLFPSLATVPADAELSALQFYAHAWRSAAEAALLLPPERLLLMEYGELVATPDVFLKRLLDHFELAAEPDRLAAMCQVQKVYSKDPGGRASFEPGGAHHRPGLDEAQEADVQRVVGDLPERLATRLAAVGGQRQTMDGPSDAGLC